MDGWVGGWMDGCAVLKEGRKDGSSGVGLFFCCLSADYYFVNRDCNRDRNRDRVVWCGVASLAKCCVVECWCCGVE